jgi:hypothetical protein
MYGYIDEFRITKNSEAVHGWTWMEQGEGVAGFEIIDNTNGFSPLKAQFRRAEIYKLALQRAVDWHNYEGNVNLSLRDITYHKLDIDYLINDAKMDIDNGK